MQRGSKRINRELLGKRIWGSRELYLMLLLPVAWYIIFLYVPMGGIQIAFRDFTPRAGFWGSKWVGLKHFQRFFNSFYFSRVVLNTLTINLSMLAVCFPLPICFALVLNELKHQRFKKTVQNITYIPHFLSAVVVVSVLQMLFNPHTGAVNLLLKLLGQPALNLFIQPSAFQPMYVLSGLWENLGWDSILFIAALAGIDPTLYEAATIDGASRFRKMISVSLPSIAPTIIIVLLMRCGQIMNIGYEKILLMQNPLNMSASDVISTFVYRSGILEADYSFATAVGLFNSLCNFALLLIANTIARKVGDTSLF